MHDYHSPKLPSYHVQVQVISFVAIFVHTSCTLSNIILLRLTHVPTFISLQKTPYVFVSEKKRKRNKRKDRRKLVPVNREVLSKAVIASTLGIMSQRQASKKFHVSLSTLTKHVRAHKRSGNTEFQYTTRIDHLRVFSNAEEALLVKHIENVAKKQNGVTKKNVRQLAFEFAKKHNKKYPEKWDDEQTAGEMFMRYFIKRNNLITIN